MTVEQIKNETFRLIDALKATCQQYGMGNDGNEYKIRTQVFLYKFVNDKFGYAVKQIFVRAIIFFVCDSAVKISIPIIKIEIPIKISLKQIIIIIIIMQKNHSYKSRVLGYHMK